MNNIRELRESLEMTQFEFAELCDISIVSVSRYETGNAISRINANKIASACQVSTDFVLGRTEVPNPATLRSPFRRNPICLTLEEENFLRNTGHYQLVRKDTISG